MRTIRCWVKEREQEKVFCLPQIPYGAPSGNFADQHLETTDLIQSAHFMVGKGEPREEHGCAWGQGWGWSPGRPM